MGHVVPRTYRSKVGLTDVRIRKKRKGEKKGRRKKKKGKKKEKKGKRKKRKGKGKKKSYDFKVSFGKKL